MPFKKHSINYNNKNNENIKFQTLFFSRKMYFQKKTITTIKHKNKVYLIKK